MTIEFLTSNDQLINEIEQFCMEWKSGQEQFIVQTSGSTGIPKQITLQREHMKASALATNLFFNNGKGNTALLCLSPTTIGGKMMIVRALEAEMNLIVVEPSSNPLERINRPIDFAAMVPMQVQNILVNAPEKMKLIRTTIIGGATISKELREELSNSNRSFFQTFGMTETISHFALRQISPLNESFYSCLPGVTISENQGSLVVHYPALGIYALETNDLVELIDSKTFTWLGRKDFTINSGGVKIHPEQIEEQLSSIIDVPFFSIGIDDKLLGERHILCVESTSELVISKEVLAESLSKYEIPKEIWHYSAFCLTSSGKINRFETIKNAPNLIGKVL